MLKENSVLREEARAALKDKWAMSAVAALVLGAIVGGSSVIPLIFLLTIPVTYGFAIAMLAVLKGKEVDLGIMFEAFNDYFRILGTKLLQLLYTFLWSLLLVIPGIVKHYSYAMTDYILKEEPALSNNAVIEKSMAMMEGNKMKLFMLDLSFIGWAILCLFTLGIGYLFLRPYMQVAHAAFYEDLKAQ